MQICTIQRKPKALFCLCFSTLVIVSVYPRSLARADIFQLKTGGEIAGVIVDRGKQGEYVVQSDQGAIVTLSRRQVGKVIPQEKIDLQYAEQSRAMPNTAEAHRKLAAWCKTHRLKKQRLHHLQCLLELDPTDETARYGLGYQQHQGRWMTRDAIMAARGMKKHTDGKYRTAQDIALREQKEKREQAEANWFRKIRNWITWLDDRRAAEAADNISRVNDPAATDAIVKLLARQKNQRIRDLLTATLAQLKHPLAVTTLVDFSLNEPDREVRLQCLEYLMLHHKPINLSPYFSALNDRKYDNVLINRSAEALRIIGDPKAISPLIDALVTTHQFKISDAPPGNTNASFSQSGGGGFSTGKKPKFYKRDIKNLKALQALVELSGGQNFEYEEKLWRRWYINEQIPEYVDARRDQ